MLLKFFFTFTKIGLFTIGGGYAVIPLIEREIVAKGWLTLDEFYEILPITESLPGVFATNLAAMVGYKIKGLTGGIVAALGTVIAPFLIIVLIAVFFNRLSDNPWVEKAFRAIRPAAVALIVAPCYAAYKANRLNWKTALIPLSALLLMWYFGLSPIWVIILGALGGISYNLVREKTN
ncbi:chromate transporter [Flavobacterium sp. JP2137]|uniref:chromate transporter n=1 Tax=Flavobacterium sp. JP2137 TaxID=3414510 RepID=UPI003D2FFFD0